MDPFISRSLKNWAVRQSLPKDGKQRLLDAAQGFSPPLERYIFRMLLDKLFSHSLQQHSYDDYATTISHAQFRVWSFYITSSIRFVA